MMVKTTDNRAGDFLQAHYAFVESLAQSAQENLAALDSVLHDLWKLGRNVILVWAPRSEGIDVLVVPNYAIADLAAEQNQARPNAAEKNTSLTFIESVVARPKQVTQEEMAEIADKLDFRPQAVDLPFVPGDEIALNLIDTLVRRYSLSFVEDRAVALFDIVNFSLYSPLEQVIQLNSLAYSVNAAHNKMLDKEIDINFARSTTGDGFYIWNRDRSIQANVNLYHFMHLVMADNAIARTKSKQNAVPMLRCCFDIGGHYEFYQSEGLNPTVYSYIVGEVTIELARMIDKAVSGQVMVGDFQAPMPDESTGEVRKIDTVQFIEKTQETLSSLKGLVLSGDAIDSIQCYLTGERNKDGGFDIHKYLLVDKHGLTRNVYNAKINIYRKQAEPIFLGVQDQDLAGFEARVGRDTLIQTTSENVRIPTIVTKEQGHLQDSQDRRSDDERRVSNRDKAETEGRTRVDRRRQADRRGIYCSIKFTSPEAVEELREWLEANSEGGWMMVIPDMETAATWEYFRVRFDRQSDRSKLANMLGLD